MDSESAKHIYPNKQLSRFRAFLPGIAALLAILSLMLLFSAAGASTGTASTADTPTNPFSTFYGGGTQECPFDPCAIAVDQDGNIIVAGTTRSDDFPLINPYTTTFTSGSGEDIFVVKLAAGTHDVLFSTYLGSGVAQGVAVDDNGDIYLTGRTSDDEFPTTTNAVQSTYQGGIDAVVVKLSADGSQLLYSSFLGGSKQDEGYDIAVDDAGDIYLTGSTDSGDFITKNAHQGTFGGDTDAFVAKISASGNLDFSTYIGGSADDQGWGIAVDDSGSAYITGRSSSDNFHTTSGVVQAQRFSGAGSDAIVVKLDKNGSLSYSTFFNQTSTNNGVDIAIDSLGNSYIIQTHEDVVKFNTDASAVLYQTDLDIETNVHSEGGIAVDGDGVAYVTGWRGSGGDKDIVLIALAPDGRVVYDRDIGGSVTDKGFKIAVYEDGAGRKNAYIAGSTTSGDFPTENPVQANMNGDNDLVILEISKLETLPIEALLLPMVSLKNSN